MSYSDIVVTLDYADSDCQSLAQEWLDRLALRDDINLTIEAYMASKEVSR